MAVPVPVQEEEDQEPLVQSMLPVALPAVADRRRIIASRTSSVISHVEAAGATLQKAAELLQEAADAAEILYADVLKVVRPGLGLILYDTLDAAAKLVDSVFTGAGTGPFTRATIHAAGHLIASVFARLPPVTSSPLQDARRDLRLLIHAHAHAGYFFNLCAPELGLLPGSETFEFWVYQQERATDQATEAHMRVNAALRRSIAAERAHRLCLAQAVRPEEDMPKAELILRQAISEVEASLEAMRDLLNTVAATELLVRNAIAQAP